MARPRSPDFPAQRAAIVRVAARLFAEGGYPATSMNDIALASGLSKALIYHYVDDKYQLLLEIADGHVSRLEALVAEVDALALPPSARLHALITRFVAEYAQARHDHQVLTQDVKFLRPEDRQPVLDKERHLVAAFATTIASLRPDLDAQALAKPLAMLLFGMMNWMFTWLRADGALSHDDMAPLVAQLFLGGLPAVVGGEPALASK